MKKTIITLAAVLALGAPVAAFAQEDPNAPPVLIPDQQQAPQAEQQVEQPVKKRKKKQQAEQPQEAQPPAAEQVEQPQETAPPAAEQVEQPVKKRKKKQQAEQPQEAQPPAAEQVEQPQETAPPAAEQAEQPVKKRKKKQQAEQPADQTQPPAEQVEQPQETAPPATDQAEQPVKKRKKKEQAEQPADQTQPPAEQTTQQPQPEQPVTGEVPPEVTQYLSDTRPASELSDAELAERARRGRALARTKGLSDEQRQALAAEAKKARAEAMAREQAKAGKGDQQQPTAEQPVTEPPATGEATKGDQQPAQPTDQAQPGGGTQPTDQANQPVVANPDKKDVQQLDGNKASPEAEAKAKAYLDDARPAGDLKDDELRARLEGMRELMAGNQLSRESERALRRKLRAERDILRNRVAEKVVVEEKQDDELPTKQRRRDRDERKWDNWAARDILRDRRRSEDLEEGELRRRIDIYREAIYDDQYDDEERGYWRDMMERDRRYLRDRMVRDRGERERYWRDRRDRNELTIDLNIDLGAEREPREAVFMDEIDDEELEDYLVAAPRRKIARRYTVEEIEEEPEVRTAMPAIEVDNVHFGFNEAFVREEEVEKLDRIAEVFEKILAAHPGEVFMIEGHTDAVGSDAYNLKLSRARAEAVKKALTTYYVIPARNLKAVGYGERYLKIPTSDAEEENRRVSMRRVTPLVGEAEEE